MNSKILPLILLMGCQGMSFIEKSNVWLEKIHLTADTDANDSMAITFCLVFVYDEDVLKLLSEKNSTEFFDQIEQIKSDFSGKADFFEYQLISGQSKNDIKLEPTHYTAKGVIAFARYNSNNTNQRKILGSQKQVRFHFKKETFEIVGGQ